MPRVKRGTKRRAKRKKILDRASGYFLTKSKLYRSAKEAVERGLKFAYSGRKQKKRQYRSLWIVRIGAAAKLNGMSYNQFIHGLKKGGVELDRKILADLAVNDPGAFKSLAEQAKGASAGPRRSQPLALASSSSYQPLAAAKTVWQQTSEGFAEGHDFSRAASRPKPAGFSRWGSLFHPAIYFSAIGIISRIRGIHRSQTKELLRRPRWTRLSRSCSPR